ncbi:hypothetical protein PM082_004247 [Marasmius tenuissimus]|nr:hypothetical protein PM082_004247 [Marasmius tenuissimus]
MLRNEFRSVVLRERSRVAIHVWSNSEERMWWFKHCSPKSLELPSSNRKVRVSGTEHSLGRAAAERRRPASLSAKVMHEGEFASGGALMDHLETRVSAIDVLSILFGWNRAMISSPELGITVRPRLEATCMDKDNLLGIEIGTDAECQPDDVQAREKSCCDVKENGTFYNSSCDGKRNWPLLGVLSVLNAVTTAENKLTHAL